jgi:hypothetical protein
LCRPSFSTVVLPVSSFLVAMVYSFTGVTFTR